MLAIKDIPDFGFGNMLLYYYNLRQFAFEENKMFSCPPFYGSDIFEGNLTGDNLTDNADFLEPCLGEFFFRNNGLSTRDIFKLKLHTEIPKKTCAIHFRGTDFHQWMPSAVLGSEYYINSIAEIGDEAETYILFTDDEKLPSYMSVLKHLRDNNKNVMKGDNTPDRRYFVPDFVRMCNCDFIISSPSTFNICAGFIGKHKKIIHSNKWIQSRVNEDDMFWVGLNNGGNADYHIWKSV